MSYCCSLHANIQKNHTNDASLYASVLNFEQAVEFCIQHSNGSVDFTGLHA